MLCYVMLYYITEFSDNLRPSVHTQGMRWTPKGICEHSISSRAPNVALSWVLGLLRPQVSPRPRLPSPALPVTWALLHAAAAPSHPLSWLSLTLLPVSIAHSPLGGVTFRWPRTLILTWIKFPFPQVKPGIHILKILTERLTHWKELFSVSGLQQWTNQNLLCSWRSHSSEGDRQ